MSTANGEILRTPYATRRYTVAHHSEEFDCLQCGCPVDVGDSAIEVRCRERGATFVVCSHTCNRRDLEDARLHDGSSDCSWST